MVLSTTVVCLLNLGGPTSWPLCVVSSYTVPALFFSESILALQMNRSRVL